MSDYISGDDVKLPPVLVSRNSWFQAAIYQATRIHIYEGFYKVERGPRCGSAKYYRIFIT